MTAIHEPIIGVFHDKHEEEEAIQELRHTGFGGDQVEVADHDKDDRADMTVSEALKSRGLPDEMSKFYQDEFRSGNDLVIVRGGDRGTVAEEIIRRHGGKFYGEGAALGERTTARAEGEKSVQLQEEELQTRKVREKSGEVAIHKHVETEEKSMEVPVTRAGARRSHPLKYDWIWIPFRGAPRGSRIQNRNRTRISIPRADPSYARSNDQYRAVWHVLGSNRGLQLDRF